MAGKTKLKAGCGIFLVFSAGFLCGVIGFFVFLVSVIPLSEGWRGDESKDFVSKHISNRLKLSDDQMEEVRPLFDRTLDQRWELRKDYIENDRELVKSALEELKPSLTEKQATRAQKMFKNWWNGKKALVMPGGKPST